MGGMPDREQRIVIRWRTRGQSEALTPALDRAYPIEERPCFDEVLKAIDESERQVWGDGEPAADDKLD
jgi:hypothetical protein